MFEARLPRLADPSISREIGMLLGNDLGQMRVQFNPKTYVVEPFYRDDGLGLWDFGEDAPASGEPLELAIDAVRLEQQEKPDQDLRPDQLEDNGSAGRARPVAADQRGIVVAKYPEWDRAHGVERPEWTTVREIPHPPRQPAPCGRGARPRRRLAQPDPPAGAQRPRRPHDPAEAPARRP